MQFGDIMLIVIFVAIGVIIAIYFYNKKVGDKADATKELIEQNKTVLSIFVIDKRYERPSEKNTPKMMYDKISKLNRFRKIGIVKAKIGPKVLTFMCGKDVYNALQTKKTVKVEAAGLYIMNIVGMNLANKKKKSLRDKLLIDYLGR